MFGAVRHGLRVLHSQLRAAVRRRSPKWRAVEKRAVAEAGRCRACGMRDRLQVHHLRPFADRPELELEPLNLIVLCMGAQECHLALGHGGSFRFWNPGAAFDAAAVRARPDNWRAVGARARVNRLRI